MKAVLFDMYGVIIREPKGNLQPYIEGFIPGITEEQVYANWLEASRGFMSSEDFLRSTGLEGDLKTIEREYLDTLHLNDGIFDAVSYLRSRGIKTALLSNDMKEWNSYLRARFDLDRLFDEIVVSGEVGLRKPMPEIYALALERIGEKADDCVFVDDQERNTKAAAALGINTVTFGAPGAQAADFPELIEIFKNM